MINSFPPGLIMMIGALLIPFLPHIIRQIYMLILILISAYALTLGFGVHSKIELMDIEFIIFNYLTSNSFSIFLLTKNSLSLYLCFSS